MSIEKKNKGGRPRKLFTEKQWAEFEDLCRIQCTKLEICDWFDIDDKTLENMVKEKYKMGFSEVFALKKGKGKISLRRSQFQMAQSNPAMAIFLGKNYLEQKDKQEVEVSGDVNFNISGIKQL